MPPLTRRPLTEQQRNLWILAGAGATAMVLLALAGIALYFGYELPPAEMRNYYTSATGYAAPPRRGTHPEGTVPRGSLSFREGEAPAEPPPTPQILALGRQAYRVNCAMCHGEPGEGIGPVGERYTPRPPDLAEHVPRHTDQELYRAITEGIRSTPTPEAAQYLPVEWHAFRAEVPARERHAIIAYLRSLFPAGGGSR